MVQSLVAVLFLCALLAVAAMAFVVALIFSLWRTKAPCPRCSRLGGMKPTSEGFKVVTRPALVAEAGSRSVVAQDDQVNIPLSDSEVLYRCRFCGSAEARIKPDVEDTPYSVW
jgi:hypothetical protein